MKKISNEEIVRRICFENPWWDKGAIDDYLSAMTPRAYLKSFYKLATETGVQRAVVLMGSRRVGKTVLLYHAVQRLIKDGVDPKKIFYVSIEAPVYTGCRLEELLEYYRAASGLKDIKGSYIFFDEVQYLKDWEIHLKGLVQDYRGTKFIASGSAAAALKLKSRESGAGRFTDFHLPPLTFYEYMLLLHGPEKQAVDAIATDINRLNDEFVNYLNYGGYPEALFSPQIKADPGRFIRSDIIDKVLLRDLPTLYGIHDVLELHKLFSSIAYNTGEEVSLDELSKNSGVAKNTIKKYLEYLEAAFLIKILHRIDQHGKRFKRANFFKVYLTNPSIRCALFGPVTEDSPQMGHMAETAVICQHLHSPEAGHIYYARWQGGEVDIVISLGNKVLACIEIKWSNRYFDNPKELKNLVSFAKEHKLSKNIFSTTKDKYGIKNEDGVNIDFTETSTWCYVIGISAAKMRNAQITSLIEKLIKEDNLSGLYQPPRKP